MTEMTSEAKFLAKAYRAFISEHLRELKEDDKSHIHPPPAFTILYNTLLNDMAEVADTNELGNSEVVLALDIILRFGLYLRDHEIDYASFKPCSCVVIDDEELNEVLKSGN